jgi:hypothetical protein
MLIVLFKERVVHLTPAEAGEFYLQNVNKRSYQALKSYISSGPVVVLVLARENAVHFWRQVIGDKTDAFKSDNQTSVSLRFFFVPLRFLLLISPYFPTFDVHFGCQSHNPGP